MRYRAVTWMPAAAHDCDQVVLLVLDGLGWQQLQERRESAPALCAMEGGAICTVAPSTTACALTSIATGLSPGAHGVVGYRMVVDDSVLNVLRWATPDGDARGRIPPASIQANLPFGGERPPVVTRAEFAHSGFTLAHLAETTPVLRIKNQSGNVHDGKAGLPFLRDLWAQLGEGVADPRIGLAGRVLI